jgi:hypothetical protein
MLVEQIDRIDIQTLGLRLYHLLDMFWPAVQALLLFGLRSTSKPNFVAMTTCSRIGDNASPTSSWLANGP